MILYIKSPKDATKKKKIIMLELMNRFSKVAGYKTNINCCFFVLLGSRWPQEGSFQEPGCFPLHVLSLLPWRVSVCSREGMGEGQMVTGRATIDRSQSSRQSFCEHQRSWKEG